jgi:hypothetical protein
VTPKRGCLFVCFLQWVYNIRMLSLIAALTIFAQVPTNPKTFYAGAVAGAPPPPWDPQGGIKSDDFKVEKRDDNGNVIGTEFVHLELTVSTREVPLPEDCWLETVDVQCDQVCLGGKHKNHGECDLSCDKQCAKNHHFTIRGYYEELRDNMNKMTADSGALTASGAAGADPPDWSSEVCHALKEAEQAVTKEVVDMTPPHVKKPCNQNDRYYGYKPSQFQVHAELHKVGFYMTKGQRTPINALLGTLDGVVALLYHPSRDVMEEDNAVVCKCQKVEIPEIFPAIIPEEDWPWWDPGFIWEDPGGKPCPPGDNVKITAHGEDLNHGVIEVDNESGKDGKCVIPPGTLLVSDDPLSQTMVVLELLEALCPANTHTSLVVSIAPEGAYSPTTMKPKVACTEISKHEPSPNTKMHLSPPLDDHLTSVCRMYKKEHIHFGGLDQARVWLCLSHSTLDQMNKILFPRVSQGTYLNALNDVASTGVDVDSGDYKQCSDLTLLDGSTSRTESVNWFVRLWERRDLKAFTAFAKGLVGREKATMASGQAIDLRHAADLSSAFLTSSSPEIRGLGLNLLAECVPSMNRPDVLQYGGLNGLWNSLASGDEAEVAKALAVVDAFGDKSYTGQVAGLASCSPNANIKIAARALKTKLSG